MLEIKTFLAISVPTRGPKGSRGDTGTKGTLGEILPGPKGNMGMQGATYKTFVI